MSKSLKNVVNPDDVVRDYGADSLRLYEMFMGPLDAVKPWQTKGIEGMNRFLGRAWRSVVGDDDAAPVYVDETAPEAIEKVMHQTVIKVTSDIENMSFNTAISQLMIFNNEMMKMDKRYREPCETLQKHLRLGNGPASSPAALALRSFREAVAPVRPAHRRRNVEHPRPQRIAHERRLARSRPFQGRGKHRGSRVPGERQGPREGKCCQGHGQGRFGKASS